MIWLYIKWLGVYLTIRLPLISFPPVIFHSNVKTFCIRLNSTLKTLSKTTNKSTELKDMMKGIIVMWGGVLSSEGGIGARVVLCVGFHMAVFVQMGSLDAGSP